jgi:hypothetical protein
MDCRMNEETVFVAFNRGLSRCLQELINGIIVRILHLQ